MDSTVPRSWQMNREFTKEDLYTFQEQAEAYFAGELKRSAFVELAAAFGCIPSREDETFLVHLPVSENPLTGQQMAYLRSVLDTFEIEQVSVTCAPGIVLHAMSLTQVLELLETAQEHGMLKDTSQTPEQEDAPERSARKAGDGGTITHPRVVAQREEGLYQVYHHPIGGYLDAGELKRLLHAVEELPGAAIRFTPCQELWIDNLTSDEAEQILNLTGSSGQSPLERSLLVLFTEADVEEPDLKEVLDDTVRAVYRAQIPEEVLPKILITDVPGEAVSPALLQLAAGMEEGSEGTYVLSAKEQDDQFFYRLDLARPSEAGYTFQTLTTLAGEQVPAFFASLGKELSAAWPDETIWQTGPESVLSEVIREFEEP